MLSYLIWEILLKYRGYILFIDMYDYHKRLKTEYGSIGSIYCIFNRVTINLLIVN